MGQFTEGQRLKGSDGNIYVVRNGVPVMEGSSPAIGPTIGGDPRLPSQIAVARGQAAAAPYDAPKAAADVKIAEANARIAEANAAVANARNATDLRIAQANLAKAQADLANTQTGKGSALDALQTQVDRVGSLYRQNLQGGVPNVVNNVIPDFLQPGKSQFDTAAQGLTNPFQAAFKVQGQGSQSDTELKQFLESNVPQQGDSDAAIEEKLRNIQTRIDAERGNLGKKAPEPQQPQDQVGFAQGKTRDQIDPALKAVGQKVGGMIAAGVPDDKIRQFLQQSGINPGDTSLDQALRYRATPAFKQWQRANPGQGYPIGSDFYTKQVPMSGTRAMVNTVSQSPVGAFGAAAANAIAGGRLDNMTSDPEMARTGMELLRAQNPLASFGGDLAGYGLAEASLGRIPGAQGLMATRWGRRGADALYGAYSGSGEDDANPVGGAFTGALTNMGGGMLGRGLQRGAGRAMTGVQNANLSYLHNRNIPLTIGQIASGSDSELGKGISGLENRLSGLPGVDAVIGEARQRGDVAFNREMLHDVGAKQGYTANGSVGVEGLLNSKNIETQAYNKLNGVNMPIDAPFAGGTAAVRASGNQLPRHSADISRVVDNVNSLFQSGNLTGERFQGALQDIRKARASLSNDVMGHEADKVLGDLENNVLGLGARQGGSVAGDLADANAIHTNRMVIKNAMKGAPSLRNGQLVSPMALDQASVRNTEKFGGLDKALSSDRPFFDLTNAAKAVMPNLTPDSGTAGRMALLGALSSAGAGLGGTIGLASNGDDRLGGGASGGLKGLGGGALLALGLSAPYSKTGQKALQRALLGKRSPMTEKLGQMLMANPRYFGMFGSGVSRDYFMQPELGQ